MKIYFEIIMQQLLIKETCYRFFKKLIKDE